MREFFIIILLRLELFSRGLTRGGKLGTVGTVIIWVGIIFFIGILSFGYTMFFYSIASNELGKILTAIFSVQVFFVTLFLLLQVIPTIALDIFDEHSNLHFYLYLPIQRGALVLSALWNAFVASPIPMILFIPLIVAFLVVKLSVMSLLAVLAYIILLSGLALASSAMVLKIVSTTFTKRFSRWMAIINILIFVLFIQFVPKLQSGMKKGMFFQQYLSKIMSPYSPVAWLQRLFSGDISVILVVFLLGVLFWRIGWRVAKKLAIEKSAPKSKKMTSAAKSLSTIEFPFIDRDLTIIFRDAETFLAIVYPIVFAGIMAIAFSNGVGYGFAMGAMLASQYSQIISLKITALDTKHIHWSATLPVDWRKTLIERAIVLSSIWTATLIIAGIALMIILQKFAPIAATIPIIFGALFAGILFAQHVWLAHPQRDTITPRNALGIKALLPAFLTALLVGIPFFARFIANEIGANPLIWQTAAFIIVFALTIAEVFGAMVLINEKFVIDTIQK